MRAPEKKFMLNKFFLTIVPHKDENQVKLDVIRSFNSYPKSKKNDTRAASQLTKQNM
jgi:hypothetical protein